MMLTYDSRKISLEVYQKLQDLKNNSESQAHSEHRTQILELYTYVATWGLLRLKAEEIALNKPSQINKRGVIKCFFQVVGKLVPEQLPYQPEHEGLKAIAALDASEYLGLTGLALQVAREFSFWVEVVYPERSSAIKI